MPELEGIEVIGLSPDSADQVRQHLARDGLQLTLLADPKLEAVDTLGLRHPNGLPFRTFFVLGIPLGWPQRFRPLAIPTTVMIDEAGIVRWIDQADDYRIRAAADRIREGLQALSPEAPTPQDAPS